MKGGHEVARRVAVAVVVTPQLRDAGAGLEQEPRGEVAQSHDHRRVHEVHLPDQPRTAGQDFVRPRIPIVGRATLDDVGDVDVFARETAGGDDAGQHLSRLSYKRDALPI